MTTSAPGRMTIAGALALATLLLATPAAAASLQQVSNWGGRACRQT